MIFKTKYGNFSFFTLPSAAISILAVVSLSGVLFYDFIIFLIKKITQFSVVGFHASTHAFNVDLFYINTQSIFFVTVILYSLVVFSILMGAQMNNQDKKINWYIVPYILVYSVIAPVWLLKAVWNSVTRSKPSWR